MSSRVDELGAAEHVRAAVAAARTQVSALAALESQFDELRNRAVQWQVAAESAEERARAAEARAAELEARIENAQLQLRRVTEALSGTAAPVPAGPRAPVASVAPAAPVPVGLDGGPYRLTQFTDDLRRIATEAKSQGEILRKTEPLVRELVLNKEWLRPEHFTIDPVQGFGVHCLHEEPNHDLAVFAVCFAPGKGAPPHDHGTWAVVGIVEGEEQNTFWKRVDDGSRTGKADLKKAAVKMYKPGDVATFTPELIHSLDNVTDKLSLSLHVYGRHLNHASRSKFDPDAHTVEPFIVRVASNGAAPEPAPMRLPEPPPSTNGNNGNGTHVAPVSAATPIPSPPSRPTRPPWRRGQLTKFETFVHELRTIVAESQTEQEILRRAHPIVRDIAKSKVWLKPEHYNIDPVQGFGVHCLHEEPNHDLGVFAVAFAPGSGAPPHDHGTWAVVAVVDGAEQNTLWRRADDGSRPGYAELRQAGVRVFQTDDVAVFTSDLIHSLDNTTDKISLSFHVYGRHLNHASRSKFDPTNRTVEPFIVRVAD